MKIELVAPEEIFAGTEVPLEIVLVSDGITRIAFADADLVATQGWVLGASGAVIHEQRNEPRHHVRLLDGQLLSAGSTTRCKLPMTFQADLPPTHELHPAYAFVELNVHVSVPGGRDVRAGFKLPIRAATPRVVVRTPASARTRTSRQAEPRLELSLASSRLVAGEVMVGSVALFHVDDHKPQQVELVVEPTLRLFGKQQAHVQGGDLHRFRVEVPVGGAGRMVTFQFRLPPTAAPTFRAATHELSWRLVARSGGWLGRRELELPLEILDVSAGATTASLTAAPRLAGARAAAVFESFAAHHGWRADDAAIGRTDAASGVELRMAYDYRGEDGTFLVARCRYPSFGVGLEVLPSSALRQLFSSSIQLGVPAWDERHQVRARNAAQVVAPLRAVVPSLLSAGVLGAVARWGDEELVIERKIVSLDSGDLLAASDALARIATNLRRARDLVPPPAEVAIDLPAWRALARQWGGDLCPGDLAITGSLDGAPLHLGLRFDDRGVALALAASLGPTATSAHDVTFEIAQPARGAVGCPARLAELIAGWPDELVDLRVADGAAAAVWRWPSTGAPHPLDATHARSLVASLRTLVGRLEPLASGPYR